MKKRNHKKARNALRWNSIVHVQYYIFLVLIVYLLIQSKDFNFLTFDSSLNIIVNISIIVSLIVAILIVLAPLTYEDLLLYSKYQLSVEEKRKKEKLQKTEKKSLKVRDDYDCIKNDLKTYN